MDTASHAAETSDPPNQVGSAGNSNHVVALHRRMEQTLLDSELQFDQLAREIEAKAKAAREKVAASAKELMKVRGVVADPVPPVTCFARDSIGNASPTTDIPVPTEQPVNREKRGERNSRDRRRQNQERSPIDSRDRGHGGSRFSRSRDRTRRARHRSRSRSNERSLHYGRNRSRSNERNLHYGRNRSRSRDRRGRMERRRSSYQDRGRSRSRSRERRRPRSTERSSDDHEEAMKRGLHNTSKVGGIKGKSSNVDSATRIELDL